eukprot:gnl/MRDRNA2_/MRDRNA2_85196_c0_seq6.p1 gnl/MRDRNA2_/MRDRNA2_85196_c0~~gnl/MRDRNA2_/MRDRNA2_85196_c0_seq6.p1  ORF type:complete len:638 (-),score=80.88 gnl/MRDRNA2_/MRDRNA2_85196_c0_seq6:525-2438(-)
MFARFVDSRKQMFLLALIVLTCAEVSNRGQESDTLLRFSNHTGNAKDKLIGRVLKQCCQRVSEQELDRAIIGKAETDSRRRFWARSESHVYGPLTMRGCSASFVLNERCIKREREKQKDRTPIQLHLKTDIVKLFQNWGNRGSFHDMYSIEEVIGYGGFGTVYKAKGRYSGRCRAVKQLDKSKINVALIRDEMQALLDVDHPQIVKFISHYEDKKYLYLVQELCTGPTLLDTIIASFNSTKGRMSETDAGIALRHMLKALKACHGKFKGHYDIKPDNFMYRTPECINLKLIDFGLSTGFSVRSPTLKGSCEYLAPETYRGIYGPEADVWSCGVSLFAMLTGSFFMEGGGVDEITQLMQDIEKYVPGRLKWASDQGISSDAQSLLKQLLLPDRHMRITVSEALHHPFVVKSYFLRRDLHSSNMIGGAIAVLKSLPNSFRKFAAQPRLVRLALRLTAHLVASTPGESEANMSPQRLAFTMLDNLWTLWYGKFDSRHGIKEKKQTQEMSRRESVGEISYGALEQALQFYEINIPDDMYDLFKFMDSNGDGYLSFTDFLSLTLPQTVFSDHANFWDVFTFFDRDNDSFISTEDLIEALGYDTVDEKEICHEALREVCPKPYRLSFEHFMYVVCNATTLGNK